MTLEFSHTRYLRKRTAERKAWGFFQRKEQGENPGAEIKMHTSSYIFDLHQSRTFLIDSFPADPLHVPRA